MAVQGVAPDSLRRILDQVFEARAYRWVERPDPARGINRWLSAVVEWILSLGDRHPAAYTALMLLLSAMLVVILVHVGWIFLQTVRSAGHTLPASDGGHGTRRTEAWYRSEADRLAAQGRFVEAMQADFLALVLALDAARLLHFHPSKTPVEYLAELKLPAEGRQEFRELVAALYGFAFARLPCDAAAFSNWRQHVVPERYASTH